MQTQTLSTQGLRQLTLHAPSHPHGQAHFSAASGLVCVHGRAYVIGDDELHLAVYQDDDSPGKLHRLLPGALPADKAARKRSKPDFESLLHLPDSALLVALGSGSAPGRDRAVCLPLRADGQPLSPLPEVDLAPLYGPLRQRLGSINIEGAFVCAGQLLLLNRGHATGAGNTVIRVSLRDFLALLAGRKKALLPTRVQAFDLGDIAGVSLGFTDGAALGAGAWVFSAVAEDSANAVADGACLGTAVGVVSAAGQLSSLQRLTMHAKVEGIAAKHVDGQWALAMVTDADDPGQAAWLLRAQLC